MGMKLFELINESTGITDIPEDKLIEFMKDNCYPWLEDTDDGRLKVFRGVKRVGSGRAFVRDIRVDRRSKDTPSHWGPVVDKIIDIAGGVANRSNAAFVSASQSIASQYGSTYVFLPIGRFYYTWSPVWDDWYTHLFDERNWMQLFYSGIVDEMNRVQSKKGHFIITDIDWEQYLKKNELYEYIRADHGLMQAINSEHEIMVAADSGLYIEPELYNNIYRDIYK